MDENGNGREAKIDRQAIDREAKIAELKALWKRTGGEEMWRWPMADSDMRYRLGRGWDDYRRFEDPAEDGKWKKDLVGEELFVRVADIPEPDRKDHLPIAQGKMECPLCRGARQVYVPHVGLSTGVKVRWPVSCTCVSARVFWRYWGDPALVPDRFKDVALCDLKAVKGLPVSEARQTELIEQAKRAFNEKRSFLIVGPPGCGKSHLSMALWRQELAWWARAVRANGRIAFPAVFKIKAVDYLQDCARYAADKPTTVVEPSGETYTKDPAEPSVTVGKILAAKQGGYEIVLLIEELDKVQINPFRFNKLFEIVDAVYNCRGRMYVTSNLPEKSLEKRLGEYGEVLLRRIKDDRNFAVIDYFADAKKGGSAGAQAPAPAGGGAGTPAGFPDEFPDEAPAKAPAKAPAGPPANRGTVKFSPPKPARPPRPARKDIPL